MRSDNDNDRKGFSGLLSLVSDISDICNLPIKPDVKNENLTKTETKPGTKFRAEWALGIVMSVILILFASSLLNNKRPSYTPPTSSQSRASQQTTSRGKLTNSKRNALWNSSVPPSQTANEARNTELEYSKPPVGTGNVLSLSEIRWCIREEIRIEAMRNVIDTNRGGDEFNRIVDDYNRRAGSYRYRQGDKSRAEREVEVHRSQIVADAILEAKQWGRSYRQPSSRVLLSPPPSGVPEKPSPQLIKETQQILTDLGYDPGPIDGKPGRRTENALKAFQRDNRLTEDGQLDQSLLNKLRNAKPRI